MKWFSLLAVILLMLATLLFASSVAYAADPPDEDSDTVVDTEVDGGLKVNIDVTGPAEVKVRAEGPSEVHINAGDEVELNVEASDESQVFVDDEKVNDNPEGSKLNVEANESQVFVDGDKDNPDDLNPDIEASDPYLVSDQNDGAPGDNHSSRLNSMAIISGAFLGAGLLAFFLVRRKKEGR